MLRVTEASATERRRIEAEKRAQENVRREHEMARAREKHLDSLASHLPQLWDTVESLITTKQPRKYDEAIKLLVDLRDLDTQCSASRGGPGQGADQETLDIRT